MIVEVTNSRLETIAYFEFPDTDRDSQLRVINLCAAKKLKAYALNPELERTERLYPSPHCEGCGWPTAWPVRTCLMCAGRLN